jgi:hypothetical protein
MVESNHFRCHIDYGAALLVKATLKKLVLG